MSFIPFGFYKAPAQASSWTPASFTDIKYWWNTGYGLTLGGSALQSWEDEVAGLTLSKHATGTGMTYTATDSALNNKPSISNDGTLAPVLNSNISGGILGGDDFTQIFIGLPDVVGSNVYSIWGGQTTTSAQASELVPYVSSPDGTDTPGFYRYALNGAGRVNMTSVSNTGVLTYHIVAYDASAGSITQYWNSTTANSTTTGYPTEADRAPFRLEIGGYNNASSLGFQGKIVEYIVLDGIPTSQELSDLDTYVSNTYS